MHPDALLPLSPQVFHILLALAGGERHGYGILLDIAGRTNAGVRVGTGTLYTAIGRLEDLGVIEAAPVPAGADDERRKYYRLTRFGRRVLEAEARRLESLVGLARDRRVLPPLTATPSSRSRSH